MRFLLYIIALTMMIFAEGKVLYSFDFGKTASDDAVKSLKSKGFEFHLDTDKFKLSSNSGRLNISTDNDAAILFGRRFKKPLENVGSVVIEWGVDKFPQGADWGRGKNRLALGAVIVLGTKKFYSGVPFAPSAPYFFGPFVGEKEQAGKKYLGKLYRKSGRYYCVSNSRGLITTRFDIDGKFHSEFGGSTPPVSAFAFQMNTKNTEGGAKAFVKKITFYSK
jgi:hypothetical protein